MHAKFAAVVRRHADVILLNVLGVPDKVVMCYDVRNPNDVDLKALRAHDIIRVETEYVPDTYVDGVTVVGRGFWRATAVFRASKDNLARAAEALSLQTADFLVHRLVTNKRRVAQTPWRRRNGAIVVTAANLVGSPIRRFEVKPGSDIAKLHARLSGVPL